MSDLRWFPPALIDEAALVSAIRDLPRFGDVRYSVGTDSTQSRALEILHRFDAGGISFVTESQEVGRGRAGRRWSSPPASGLLLSTVLPTALRGASLPAVGFWAAMCVADSVAAVCGITLGMKWPNDLLLDGCKCAGILSEARTVGNSTRVVVGVGLNVNRPAMIPADLPSGAAWLSDAVGAAVDRTALVGALLAYYEARYDDLLHRPREIVAAWVERSSIVGSAIRVNAVNGTTMHEGRVVSVSADGALELATPGGPVTVTLGDVEML